MRNARTPATWQELLGQLIEDSKRREALARAIRVRPVTLHRWAQGISRPREENIRALLKKVPAETYPLFMRLLLQSFPELLQDLLPEERLCQTIPGEFYARALSNLASTPQPMYRLSMQDLLLQQQLEQLDPDRHGLAVAIVVCVPPRAGRKVRSLRELGGLGTPPWPANLTIRPLFLGAESLVGYAVQHLRPLVVNSKEEMTFLPARWTEFERSMAAFPILLRGWAAGGLLVSSTQEFFFTETRLSILEGYSHLASCLFESGEAYAPTDIDLQILPDSEQQRPYFQDYSRQVSQKFAELTCEQQQITIQQVRQLVWQDIEERLLPAPLHLEESNKS